MRAGIPQLLIVLAIVLLFFGARRLPDLAGSIGRSLKEFRRSMDGSDDDEPGSRDTSSPDAPTTDRDA